MAADKLQDNEAQQLGANLARAREEAGLTQDEVFQRLGMKRRETVSDHERGKFTPRQRQLEAYATLYRKTVRELRYGWGAEVADLPAGASEREPYSPNPALARDYPPRAYQVVLGYLNRLERAGLSHEEIERFERTLLNRRFAQRFRTTHGIEWTEDDYVLHVESLWQAMIDALATRGVVP